MWLFSKIKPMELLSLLITVLNEFKEGIITEGPPLIRNEGEFRQGSTMFLKAKNPTTWLDCCKFCRTAFPYTEILVTRREFKIRDIFQQMEVAEAWIHLSKSTTMNVIVESSTLYLPSIDLADGAIGITSDQMILDSTHAAILRMNGDKMIFASVPPTSDRSCICFRKLSFPEREEDNPFFLKMGESISGLIDESVSARETEKTIISAIIKMTPSPPSGVIDSLEVSSNIDLQTPISKKIEELKTLKKNFVDSYANIKEPMDATSLLVNLDLSLKKAENTANLIMAPFISPSQLLSKEKIEQVTKPTYSVGTVDTPTTIWLEPDTVLIEVNEKSKGKFAGFLPLNSPADFFDVSLMDLLFALFGIVAGISTGLLAVYRKCRDAPRETMISNEGILPRVYQMRIPQQTRYEVTSVAPEPCEEPLLVHGRNRTLPRNAVRLENTLQRIPESYELPLWRN
jgi:hypothetical protein